MADPMRDADDEKPLDPAVERIRRRMVRFVAINLGILFAALMAVVLALVYKSMTAAPGPEAAAPAATAPVTGAVSGAAIPLPAGARILSQSLSGDRLSLHVSLPGGGEAFLIYGLAEGRVLATLPVEAR